MNWFDMMLQQGIANQELQGTPGRMQMHQLPAVGAPDTMGRVPVARPSISSVMSGSNGYPSGQIAPMGPTSPDLSSPIQSGARSGIEAAKTSASLSPREERRALGMALSNLFSKLGQPGYRHGLGGALGAINEQFWPAMQTLQQQEEYQLAKNRQLSKEEELRRRQEKQDAFAREKFEFEKGYKEKSLGAKESRKAAKADRDQTGHQELQRQKHLRLLDNDINKLEQAKDKAIEDAIKAGPKFGPDKVDPTKIESQISKRYEQRIQKLEQRRAHYLPKSLGPSHATPAPDTKKYIENLDKEAMEIVQPKSQAKPDYSKVDLSKLSPEAKQRLMNAKSDAEAMAILGQ